ncbi:MAG: hypothetical protein D6752_01350, partial [Candidatus Nitrosothermus koennekii]
THQQLDEFCSKYASRLNYDSKILLKAYDRAITINPNYAAAWNNKGYVLDELQMHVEAIETYNKARLIFESINKSEYATIIEIVIKKSASKLLKKDCTNMSIDEILKEIKG